MDLTQWIVAGCLSLHGLFMPGPRTIIYENPRKHMMALDTIWLGRENDRIITRIQFNNDGSREKSVERITAELGAVGSSVFKYDPASLATFTTVIAANNNAVARHLHFSVWEAVSKVFLLDLRLDVFDVQLGLVLDGQGVSIDAHNGVVNRHTLGLVLPSVTGMIGWQQRPFRDWMLQFDRDHGCVIN